jgi:HEAT repeat protein
MVNPWFHCCIFVVFTAVLGCSAKPDGEPKAGGKPLAHWLESLHDRDPAVRQKAATKLGNIGGASPEVVPALTTAVKDPDAGVRAEAILSLLKIGPSARDAVPALTAALKDPDAKVRLHAQKALERVQGS